MSKPRKAETSEFVRRLAVARLDQGHSIRAVADFLGVTVRSVQRWVQIRRTDGDSALIARLRTGRPRKLNETYADTIISWLEKSPTEFGFPTQRWTSGRVAELVDREMGVSINRRYLSDWLRRHGITPQVPRRVALERDDAQIAWWVSQLWPHIKKKPAIPAQTWFLPMKAAF